MDDQKYNPDHSIEKWKYNSLPIRKEPQLSASRK